MFAPLRRAGSPLALLAVALVALAGCAKDAPTKPLPVSSVAPDWTLTDVNPNSPTHGQAVSPRGQLGKISAWYFGHST